MLASLPPCLRQSSKTASPDAPGNLLAVAQIAFRLLSAVAAREIPSNVAVAKWQITRKPAKVNRNMKFSPKETAAAAVPNSSRKSRSIWNGAFLAATVIALVATIQVWVADDEKSSCRIFADGTFYCWYEQPPPLVRTNDQYYDCAYEPGKVSSDCVAWYAKHLDHH
ncbi:hypothetical protein GR217_32635 [Rhizobium leguminosarum]|uniref:Transmembrane protein n=1 Tax=Rhizobium ruizarguesonis TaxID=2081791 RepID=A0AAE4YY30_9HYPH|nr:hypothetical protein [Rhizobium ruizarguesonis]NEI52383.1 hypothetical protein [Rhizobium ruizarguesonis]